MAYPVAHLVRPIELSGQSNGRLDTRLLYPIEGGQLLRNAAASWKALAKSAAEAGIELKPTSTNDTYRPYEIQERIFRERYLPYYNFFKTTTQWKDWAGQRWYKRRYVATAAAPGTSNHGWGLAVDFAGAGGARLQWMLKVAPRFGFSWEIQSEPWHVRYVLGDALPPGVFLEEPPVSPPISVPQLPTGEEDMTTMIRADDGTPEVYATDWVTKRWIRDGNQVQKLNTEQGIAKNPFNPGEPLIVVWPAQWVNDIPIVGSRPPGYNGQ